MKTLLIVFLLTPLFYFSQTSDEWKYVTESPDHIKAYVKNVKKNTCWVKLMFPVQEYTNKDGKDVTGSFYIIRYMKTHCETNQYQVLQNTLYNSKGLIEVPTSTEDSEVILEVIPDTVVESIMKYTCNPENQSA